MRGGNRGNRTHGNRPEPFWRYFLCWPKAGSSRGVPLLFRRRPGDIAPVLVVVITALLGYCLDRLDSFHLLEMRGLDFQLAVQKTEPSQDIYIVKINDADYSGLFGARSPLNTCVVKDLVSAVMDLRPKVIGVDLYTTDFAWRTICDPTQCTPGAQLPKPVRGATTTDSTAQDTMCLEPKNGPAVIWAATPESTSNQETYTWEKNKDLVVLPPLGGQWWPGWESFSGIPGFPQDSDGRVRSYIGQFTVNGGTTTIRSFSGVIAKEYCGCARSSKEQRIFNFGSPTEFPSISASDLMSCDHHLKPETCVFKTGENEGEPSPPPRGRVVLIGGEFRAARDTYDTPRGLMPGVRLNGMAIESDLGGGGYKEPEWWKRFLADLILGFLLTLCYWYFRLKRHAVLALLVGTVGMSIVALLFSYYLFQVFAFCLPVLVGINLHQYLEHIVMAARE